MFATLQRQRHSAASREQAEADSLFNVAVGIIKKYETLHSPRHWPFVGYGHKVLRGEKYSRNKKLSEQEADALLRKDLRKNCAVFRSFGKDSLLLGVLAYNIGSGAVLRSSVTKQLRTGNRNIRELYLSHCRYRGKTHNKIRQRRIEEFDKLFIQENHKAIAEPAVPNHRGMLAEEHLIDKVEQEMHSLVREVIYVDVRAAFMPLAFVTPEAPPPSPNDQSQL